MGRWSLNFAGGVWILGHHPCVSVRIKLSGPRNVDVGRERARVRQPSPALLVRTIPWVGASFYRSYPLQCRQVAGLTSCNSHVSHRVGAKARRNSHP